jgi:hypothetical protein
VDPIELAIRQCDSRLEMDAATETADAFNDEYRTETDDIARHWQRHSTLYALPLKIWDATLDRLLCERCASVAGTIRPWGVPFPRGQRAGSVHPRCRCREATLILATPNTRVEREQI